MKHRRSPIACSFLVMAALLVAGSTSAQDKFYCRENITVPQPLVADQEAFYVDLEGDLTDKIAFLFETIDPSGVLTDGSSLSYDAVLDVTTARWVGFFPFSPPGVHHFGVALGPGFCPTSRTLKVLERGWEETVGGARTPVPGLEGVAFQTDPVGVVSVSMRNATSVSVDVDAIGVAGVSELPDLPDLNASNFPITGLTVVQTGVQIPASGTDTISWTVSTMSPLLTNPAAVVVARVDYTGGVPFSSPTTDWFGLVEAPTIPALHASLLAALAGVLASTGIWMRWRQRRPKRVGARSAGGT